MSTLFRRMFGEKAVHNFSAGHTKVSYLVRHGLSGVLLDNLVAEVNASQATFTLMLDETTTAQVLKQCDFLCRYWSENSDEVTTRYLTSTFFGHTTSEAMRDMVTDIFKNCGIEISKFANLSLDGPNINKGLHQRLHSHLIEGSNHPGLFPFLPYPLHKVHTCFKAGLLMDMKLKTLHLTSMHGSKLLPAREKTLSMWLWNLLTN